ncbi:[protein-PII] uridylyltransferase [Limisphaera ngatamarikiensis]|uniref:Bifunctional uridylyltransferase/uridylyl-removing enzyme n=1 Tax=Limisphaera ngatamarikiensis TaxID=1324935 RepID=A0A6M1RQF0_9BACT|nr:[protein-PII] uridylyltransferase [Limisphaera ngatamarikiensis]NGO39769.1 [protein-PII] uridylyltransferase [Limisphaera ngatamarikiensis]
MEDWLEQIEAEAAVRLRLGAGRTVAEELDRFRAFLKRQTQRLRMWHRRGGGGREVCQARAHLYDVLLRQLWEASVQRLLSGGISALPEITLVAVGGYGRGELNPFSDLDFMLLHDGAVVGDSVPSGPMQELLNGVLYPLWDLGVKVGHAVRTLDEAVAVANSDMQSKTALLEARWIVGDLGLFDRFQRALQSRAIRGKEREYIAARLEDQAARRARYGNSPCMQEPNLKNGCGGLRDYQNLLWMARVKFGVRSLGELEATGRLTPGERKALESAHDFLLRVRTELHYQLNRAGDVLGKNLQPAVALALGYEDRSPSRRIERFMRELYTHTRNIHLITRTLEEQWALVPPPGPRQRRLRTRWLRREPRERVVDGFLFEDGRVRATSEWVFQEQPRRLMRVFLHAQQRGCRLHPDLIRLIRQHLRYVNRTFLHDAHVSETFLAILDQRGNVGATLRAMHEVGLLGKYIPEFGRLTCLVQHEFYHQYTADEHTLVCIEQLDRVWHATEPPYRQYAPLLQQLERPWLLYLALLLHDTGRHGSQGPHAVASAQLAGRVARRLGLDRPSTEALQRLIEHHLLMATLSQRRDLEDPAVIQRFAAQVGDLATLQRLTLLTFVDALATSGDLWNGFKDALLRQLYEKTVPLLSGDTRFLLATQKRKESLLAQVRHHRPDHLGEDEIAAHFDGLPARYFEIRTASEILEDLELVHRFLRLQIAVEERALEPVIGWHDDVDRGCAAVKVCTWDRERLFSLITGAFSAAGLNILTARIFTRADDIALDAFHVTDARTGGLPAPEQKQQFQDVLTRLLRGEALNLPALIARHRRLRPLYQGYEGESIATRVRFDSETSDLYTLVEIETEDRVGLLYDITRLLAEARLNIASAVICTERGAAIDTFYVTDRQGQKWTDPAAQQQLARRLGRMLDGARS